MDREQSREQRADYNLAINLYLLYVCICSVHVNMCVRVHIHVCDVRGHHFS